MTRRKAMRQSSADAKSRKAKARRKAKAEFRTWIDRKTTPRRSPAPMYPPALGLGLSLAAMEMLIATPEERMRDMLEGRGVQS